MPCTFEFPSSSLHMQTFSHMCAGGPVLLVGQEPLLAPGINVLAELSSATLHKLGCRVLYMTLCHTPHPNVAAGAVCLA